MAFSPVYRQGQPGNGIGGYDLKSKADRVFALDYNSVGKLDHLCLYRPGTGAFFILQNSGGTFTPVYSQGDPGSGIGGYDLKHVNDVAFAFDYEATGKLDHIVLYRPGFGAIYILKRSGTTWGPVYAQSHLGSGIGGYDLKSANDRIFAFDYNHSGSLDHLAIYRPGKGTFWILRRIGTTWSPVFAEGDPGKGIGGYDLAKEADRAFAYDYDGSGKLDHIALYRPGTGAFFILKNSSGTFSPVYSQGDPGNGIGGFDLSSTADVALAYDWDKSGKNDHILIYRPGKGTLWVIKKSGTTFSPVFAEGDPGNGIGGYDLKNVEDKVVAFDYEGSKSANYLVTYRTNATGTIWILKHLS